MADDDDRRTKLDGEQLFEPEDAFEVEMVGRLVEQQQVGGSGPARARSRAACASRRRASRCERDIVLKADSAERYRSTGSFSYSLVVIVFHRVAAGRSDGPGLVRIELRLLRHISDPSSFRTATMPQSG